MVHPAVLAFNILLGVCSGKLALQVINGLLELDVLLLRPFQIALEDFYTLALTTILESDTMDLAR